jgi:hypothetical protein
VFVLLHVFCVLAYYILPLFVKCVGKVTCLPNYAQDGSAGNSPDLLGIVLTSAGKHSYDKNFRGFSSPPKAISFLIHHSGVTLFDDVCSTAESVVE